MDDLERWYRDDVRRSLTERGMSDAEAIEAVSLPEAEGLIAAGLTRMLHADLTADRVEGIWRMRNVPDPPAAGRRSPVL